MPRPFRLLHTADWHLGKSLLGVSRLDDQAAVLEQLHAHVAEQKPDVVLIAGDVYDRAVPPGDAVALLDRTLRRLVLEQKTPVVLIAGNHDSPERLGFGAELLQSAGLHMRGPVDWQAAPILFETAGFPVHLCPLPYAEPQPASDRDPGARDHEAALQRQVAGMLAQVPSGALSVAVAHAFVRGGSIVEGTSASSGEVERPLAIGGGGLVDASVFAPFAYTALGHLHRPQQVGNERMRYSGSLLQYSFAEAGQAKQVCCVDLHADGRLDVTALPLVPRRPLRRLEGTLAELVRQGQQLQQAGDAAGDAWVFAVLTDEGELLDAMAKLRVGWPNALGLSRKELEASGPGQLSGDHRARQPLDVIDAFWRDRRDVSLTADQRTLLQGLLAELTQARGEEGAP